ncbi:hypothetical protein GCM10028794_28510 [Silanimonas algicola]
MSRMVFRFVTWSPPRSKDAAQLAAFSATVEQEGAHAVARQTVPFDSTFLLWMAGYATAGFLTAMLGSELLRGDARKVAEIVGVALIVWAMFQAPLYVVSLLIARARCLAWLRGLGAQAAAIVRVHLHLAGSSRASISEAYFPNELEAFRAEAIKRVPDRIPESRRNELWSRMVLDGARKMHDEAERYVVRCSLAALSGDSEVASAAGASHAVRIGTDGLVLLESELHGQRYQRVLCMLPT